MLSHEVPWRTVEAESRNQSRARTSLRFRSHAEHRWVVLLVTKPTSTTAELFKPRAELSKLWPVDSPGAPGRFKASKLFKRQYAFSITQQRGWPTSLQLTEPTAALMVTCPDSTEDVELARAGSDRGLSKLSPTCSDSGQSSTSRSHHAWSLRFALASLRPKPLWSYSNCIKAVG